jgi:hypothetical protein
MGKGSTVLVTVHGIGFQQPPVDGRPGYADGLHARLRTELGALLGDDPERPDGGPVYVRSEVDGSREQGLARLGPGKALAQPGRIAHVALVYSPSEPLVSRAGSVADALARAALAHRHYTSVLGALRLVFGDAWAALHETSPADASSSLRPRSDAPIAHAHHAWLDRVLHGRADPQAPLPPPDPGAFGMLRALEDDVATYVARNDLRERVRGFVQAALLALWDRAGADDVTGVVVNGHSQGTVLTWDVLCRLPFYSWRATDPRRAQLLRHYVTAGSPIRKYVDMFAWGEQVGQLAAVFDGQLDAPAWSNFWDPHDPVADPLDAATAWRFGDPLDKRPAGDLGLLLRREPAGGPAQHVAIADVKVDNVHDSAGGGLQAHDYWNNQTQFVAPLAEILRRASGAGA